MSEKPSKDEIKEIEKHLKKLPLNYVLLTIGYLLCVGNGSLFLGFILLKRYNFLTLFSFIVLVLNIISAESSRRTINYMVQLKINIKLYHLFNKENEGDDSDV